MLDQRGKDFIKLLGQMKPSRNTYDVFSDWLILAATTLYSWKRDSNVEQEYLDIAKNYTKEELEKHARLLAMTIEAHEDKEQDFLGEVFTYGELTNSRTGQFFTPYHISRMMAEITMGEEELPKNRVCRIYEPCCGAGGMMIASAMVLKERGFNYQRDALFMGQDIDARCARMAYIQLSLLNAPAVIYCMDTLSMKEYWHRETIGYQLADMDFRLRAETIIEVVKNLENSALVQAQEERIRSPPEVIALSPSRVAQGELF